MPFATAANGIYIRRPRFRNVKAKGNKEIFSAATATRCGGRPRRLGGQKALGRTESARNSRTPQNARVRWRMGIDVSRRVLPNPMNYVKLIQINSLLGIHPEDSLDWLRTSRVCERHLLFQDAECSAARRRANPSMSNPKSPRRDSRFTKWAPRAWAPRSQDSAS